MDFRLVVKRAVYRPERLNAMRIPALQRFDATLHRVLVQRVADLDGGDRWSLNDIDQPDLVSMMAERTFLGIVVDLGGWEGGAEHGQAATLRPRSRRPTRSTVGRRVSSSKQRTRRASSALSMTAAPRRRWWSSKIAHLPFDLWPLTGRSARSARSTRGLPGKAARH